MRVSLHRALLTYGGGLRLHTATSGKLDGLDALYLRLDDGEVCGAGEVRINIEYLNGLPADEVLREAVEVVGRIRWDGDLSALIGLNSRALEGVGAPVRMLIDGAVHDLLARRAGKTLAEFLGGDARPVSHPTNQTLFLSSDDDFVSRAESYVRRGFRDLKVRVGAGSLDDDLRRISLLRDRFGGDVEIALDANGSWDRDTARKAFDALAPLNIAYVEQPLAATDEEGLTRLAAEGPIPVMLDESVASLAHALAVAADPRKFMAHIKLVKLGGIAPALAAIRALQRAGVAIMIGQMNEGGLATAAALHLACAAKPRFAELYGADGLVDDPAPGLTYADGCVSAPAEPGLGLTLRDARTQLIKEYH